MRPSVCALIPLVFALAPATAGAQLDAPPAFLRMWGTLGTGPGQFDHPYGLVIDALGFVYVTDQWNDRVQKFLADGTYVMEWGIHGSGPGHLFHPVGIAIDSHGDVYVVEHQNHRVSKFTSGGAFLGSWGGGGGRSGGGGASGGW